MEPESSETKEMSENQSLTYGLIGASTILLTIGLTFVIVKHVQHKREMNVIFLPNNYFNLFFKLFKFNFINIQYFFSIYCQTFQIRFDRHRARAHDDAEAFKRDLLRE